MAVFALPAVQAVIHFKWNKWARRFLLIELGAYVTWLLAFTSFTLLFQQEDGRMSFWAMISTWWGGGGEVGWGARGDLHVLLGRDQRLVVVCVWGRL